MILKGLRAKLYVGAAFVLGVMLAVIRVLTKRNSKLRQRVENAEAKAIRAVVIAKKDDEIEEQTDSHRADLIKELEDNNDSSGFRDPNQLWDKSDDT